MCSFFLVSLMILPDGVWTANLAGFVLLLPEEPEDA
jgi:hypothetical protein